MAGPGDDIAAAAATGRRHLRASRADREHVIDTLKVAFVRGLLDKDEFDLRVGQTFASRTYAELAAVTADFPIEQMTAQPPKLARAQGEQPVLHPRPVIIAATVLYAGVWPLAFLLPKNSEGDPKAAAQLIFSATFVYLAVLAIAVGHAVAGRRKERSGEQPPRRPDPGADGQALNSSPSCFGE
jgi:hypothetical protein